MYKAAAGRNATGRRGIAARTARKVRNRKMQEVRDERDDLLRPWRQTRKSRHELSPLVRPKHAEASGRPSIEN
jgi:hypothetical protein